MSRKKDYRAASITLWWNGYVAIREFRALGPQPVQVLRALGWERAAEGRKLSAESPLHKVFFLARELVGRDVNGRRAVELAGRGVLSALRRHF